MFERRVSPQISNESFEAFPDLQKREFVVGRAMSDAQEYLARVLKPGSDFNRPHDVKPEVVEAFFIAFTMQYPAGQEFSKDYHEVFIERLMSGKKVGKG